MKVPARKKNPSINIVAGEWARQESHSHVPPGSDTQEGGVRAAPLTSFPRPDFTDLSSVWKAAGLA